MPTSICGDNILIRVLWIWCIVTIMFVTICTTSAYAVSPHMSENMINHDNNLDENQSLSYTEPVIHSLSEIISISKAPKIGETAELRLVVHALQEWITDENFIVRGTTLRESIITSLSQLKPKRIVVVSSAPPIMYPDCYGIDMSQLGKFIAFEAAVLLTNERGNEALFKEIEDKCKAQVDKPIGKIVNHVKEIYAQFTLEEISKKVAQIVKPKSIKWDGKLNVVYQDVEGLHASMPEYTGDWYFTGDYPTPGGNAVVNRAYLNWCADDDDARSY